MKFNCIKFRVCSQTTCKGAKLHWKPEFGWEHLQIHTCQVYAKGFASKIAAISMYTDSYKDENEQKQKKNSLKFNYNN